MLKSVPAFAKSSRSPEKVNGHDDGDWRDAKPTDEAARRGQRSLHSSRSDCHQGSSFAPWEAEMDALLFRIFAAISGIRFRTQ
jgi:hypothetical protein